MQDNALPCVNVLTLDREDGYNRLERFNLQTRVRLHHRYTCATMEELSSIFGIDAIS